MRNRILLILILLSGLGALAQPTVAPSTESVGKPRGENWGDYTITDSFETGYRWRTVGGSFERYQSDVNFQNGFRLLSSSFAMYSRDGKGRLFDELTIETQGLGNDPYESARMRVAKNRWYRYDLMWRSNDYINAGLSIVDGQHAIATTHQLQDHDLTLFPQSKVRLFLGYSRSSQQGPALSTINFYGQSGNEFPVFLNIRRQQNEYRVGGEALLAGFKLNVMHGWSDYKDDTPVGAAANAGDLGGAGDILNRYLRREPIHGTAPYWRVALFRDFRQRASVQGRFTYSNNKGRFVQDELATGTVGRAGDFQQETVILGDGRRPVATGNLTLSATILPQVTVTNQTSYYSLKMEGNNYFQQFDYATLSNALYHFEALDLRTISNSTLVNWQPRKWIGLFAGYQYADRQIRSVAGFALEGFSDATTGTQTNIVHTGTAGIRLKPMKPLTIVLDSEVGGANLPIYPTSERNFHALGARVQWKLKTVTLGAHTKANYNFNSTSATAFSSRSRNYSLDAAWNPRAWLTFAGGYAKLHQDTASGIVYLLLYTPATGQYSYLSNVHSLYLQSRVSIRNRVDLNVGLSSVEDVGDGRNLNGPVVAPNAAHPFAYSAETFPMAYRTPSARLSVRLNTKLRWNAGYQYYGYRQSVVNTVTPAQGYRANTGFTSLLWSF